MNSPDWEVVVVGAGAAGLLAAARAAERGRRTLLIEKNRQPGVKILMSGGTRCNLTHACDSRSIVAEFGPPGRFLHSALAALSPAGLVELFEDEGVATKIEAETGKVFPVSDRAADVLTALLGRFTRSGATLSLGEPLIELTRLADRFVLQTSLRTLHAHKVLITTGGQSYPGCGTSGDGYRWLAALGHTIVAPRPALTPVTTEAGWVRDLQGVTISDVLVRVVDAEVAARAGGAPESTARRQPAWPAQRRGSFLFTHFGLSGPVVLDVSRVISGHPRPHSLTLVCDFFPHSTEAQLEERIKHEAATAGKKQLGGLLAATLLPRRLTDALLRTAGLMPESRAAELGRAARARLVAAIKRQVIPVSGTRGFKKAEVTAGGVALDEVDSRTMQSRLVPALYLAGEVLDIDGPIGGYNFQAAFSTGWLAAEHV